MVELINISKSFKDIKLLDNISLNITKKKTKIIGVNGCGKSVILKLIVGYSKPDEGSIVIDNNLLGTKSDFLQDAGVIINAPQFIKGWTGFENLKYLQNINNTCSNQRLDELINIFGLEKDINKKYKTYSLGMQQKLRIIQALMDEPRFLILDEPFDSLDRSVKKELLDYLDLYLNEKEERQLIFTSHDDNDSFFADEIYELDNYKLVKVK